MPMELTQSRIQKIWLPNDNRPALPRRCEYGHGSIPEEWDGGMGDEWMGSSPLSLRTAAGLFAASLLFGVPQHPGGARISPPSASRRCPHPGGARIPFPSIPAPASQRCHPVTHSRQGRKVHSAVTWPRRMRGGAAGTRMAPFPLSAASAGIKREGSRLFTSVVHLAAGVPAQLGFAPCQAARPGIC